MFCSLNCQRSAGQMIFALLKTSVSAASAGPWKLERELQRRLDLSGVVLLRRIDTTEIRTRRVRVGPPEAHMVEGIEGLETELNFDPLHDFEVLVNPEIQLVHAARPDVAPAGRIPAHVVAEILVDAILDRVTGRRLVIIARQILNASPGRIGGDVGVTTREADEVRGIEPPFERALIAAQV